MEAIAVNLKDVLLIKPKVFGDERGCFVETWQQDRYSKFGIIGPFVQDNHSRSRFGILRGLHFQNKHPQGKLVSVSYGSVFDVVVDIRIGSPSFGKWYGVELSHTNHWQLWVPPGLAHGFVVTSETAHFHYKVTDHYYPEDEGSIRWDDPTLNISWPVTLPQLSEKDMNAPSLGAYVNKQQPIA
jgi:dTDP-4-dehydrorhamnose 3,5-epimerase